MITTVHPPCTYNNTRTTFARTPVHPYTRAPIQPSRGPHMFRRAIKQPRRTFRRLIVGAGLLLLGPSVAAKLYSAYNEVSISKARRELELERVELERRRLQASNTPGERD